MAILSNHLRSYELLAVNTQSIVRIQAIYMRRDMVAQQIADMYDLKDGCAVERAVYALN